ncbi:MAG: hypothetical protein AAF611_01090 [Bacteroidota bacterium]
MKKQKLANLQLNKKVISTFDVEKVKGQGGPRDLTKEWYIDEEGYYVCFSFFCPG